MLESVTSLVPHLAEQLELALPGSRALSLTPMTGQLSTRRYYRAALATQPGKPDSLIVMQLPDADPDGTALAQALAFGDIQHFIRSQGLRAPHIYGDYHTQLEKRLMLLEDLGDETFEARIHTLSRSGWDECYEVAIDNLAQLHRGAAESSPSACIALRRQFDQKLLRWELDHFREWGLEALHGQLSAADRSELDAHFDALSAAIVALPKGFVHRDYQSRNLMWARAEPHALAIIDFQDAFMGPFAYDLVALLCDSYVAVDTHLQDVMLLRYAQRRSYDAAQEAQLVRAFRLIAVQRKLKDAGRFIYIDRVRKIPNFVEYYPASLAYASCALSGLPELDTLRRCLERLVPGFPQ